VVSIQELQVSYTEFVVRRRYQRGILRWSWNEGYLTIRLDIHQAGAPETTAKSVTPCLCFRLVITCG